MGVDMGRVTYRRSNVDPYEQFALMAIAQLRRPKRVFEIGTYNGDTTLLLAKAAPDAELWTLDLSSDDADVATDRNEAINAKESGIGVRFHGTPEADRITQLFGDSREFDFAPWNGAIDLVLVDGGHDYDVVRSDTITANRLVAPGGLIIWDDYSPAWPGVVRAVDESAATAFHLAATDLAIYTS
jgi:predicted O-methyltransferase YrrM